ncbi:hypothetical protein NQ318_012291 [Aromia moschata]|uniref:Histidine-rich glycoprotein-like n=1 Tax=Aromia moschata TaxID=1265417 RepID=A0AAV8YL08_9CUCU|nr:hypothetical protein NQ318_012291 [Aromia moschata]
MAQFVTHIQPTLVESSHHHIPHPHHHKDHHRDHHSKEHGSKEHHHAITKSPHRGDHRELPYKDGHLGHSKDFPVLPHTPLEHHHEEETSYDGRKRDSGQYLDSHGMPHTFELHFVDSQGIHRDYHGHGIDDDYRKEHHGDQEKRHEGRRRTSPLTKKKVPGRLHLNLSTFILFIWKTNM